MINLDFIRILYTVSFESNYQKLEEKLCWPDRELNETYNRLHKGEVNTNNENELK